MTRLPPDLKMPEKHTDNWEEIVFRGVESDHLDYKSHQSWNQMSAAARGKFVRHLAAFANTDGGYLVVGVSEDDSGSPTLRTGLTEEESRSFDPSTVGAYVNRCIEPAIDFTLERPVVNGKRYAIFAVRPFKELPHVCCRTVDNELQDGVFYIRTPDASSRPAHRAGELHQLIRRALRNQRGMLANVLRGVLYENNRSEEDNESDIFYDSMVYFKRRRIPAGGAPLLQIAISTEEPLKNELTRDAVRAAVAAAIRPDSVFITRDDLPFCHPANRALRRLDEKAPRMFQLFYSGAFHYITSPVSADGSWHLAAIEKFISDAAGFIGDYYKALNAGNKVFSISLECSGIDELSITGRDGSVYQPRQHETRLSFTRRGYDLTAAPAVCAERMFRSIAEAFLIPESELSAAAAGIAGYFAAGRESADV